MRIVSLNVAQPRSVPYAGRLIETGIFKKPVEGRRTLGVLNVDGDGQADLKAHGGANRAAYAYDIGQLNAWSGELGRQLLPGAFGENLTVSGMSDSEVRIGDQYRIGTAIVEVSQPRSPCFKLGIALADESMPGRLVSTHRPGFYLRVLTDGEIGAGDSVMLLYRDSGALTVAEVNDLLWLSPRSRDRLVAAARMPALSSGWRDSFDALLQADTSGAGATAAPAWAGFRDFVVTRIVSESATVRSFYLSPNDAGTLAPFLPGQAVTIHIGAAEGEPPVVRTYSLSSSNLDSYRITVRRAVAPSKLVDVPPGRASTLLHDAVKTGDILGVGAPRGTFVLPRSPVPIAFVSAGVGITPMIPMLAAVAEQGSDAPVLFAHTTHDDADEVLLEEVRAIAASSKRVTVRIVHTRSEATGLRPRSGVESGRITPAWLVPLLPPESHVYLCGPPAFITDLAEGLTANGVAAERIHIERFGSAISARHERAGEGSGPSITFARSQQSLHWKSTYANLLEFAESLGIDAPYACRVGICQTCATDVISGAVEQQIESVRPAPVGQALLCCSVPLTDVVLDL